MLSDTAIGVVMGRCLVIWTPHTAFATSTVVLPRSARLLLMLTMLLPRRTSPARISPGGVTPEGSPPPPAPAPAPAPAPTPAPGPVPTPGSAAPRATNGHVNHGTVRDTPAVTRSRATTVWHVPVATRYEGGRNNNRATLVELLRRANYSVQVR